MTDLRKTIEGVFRQKSVVIVGDLVADQFLNGTINRVSREAPVFILRHDLTETRPGAAANAAVNVASLGGRPVLIGLVGADRNGELLLNSLEKLGVGQQNIVHSSALATTTKVRVLAGQHYAARQQVIRIDYEDAGAITAEMKAELQQNLATAGQSADAIVISDYGYGSVFPEIFEDALAISHKRAIPLIVDSRFGLSNFPGATSATPNSDEVEQLLGKNFTSDDCSLLRERLGYRALLVTNGNKGMMLFEGDRVPLNIAAIGSSVPVDVTGAGDTVIAAYTLGLASGLSFADATTVANHAGGIVVMKRGTASATAAELLDSIGNNEISLASTHTK